MKESNDEQAKISTLACVMGYIAVKELQSIPEKVRILSNFGFTNKEMAVICDTTESTVAKQKTLNKKKKK